MEKEKKIEEKREVRRCKKCKSSFGYLRLKDKSWCCRSCGFIDAGVVI